MKNQLIKILFKILIIPFVFLVISIFTIPDYGINWDEPYHFMRGQAYLHFLMTGEKDYSSLYKYPRLSKDCPDWASGTCGVSPGGATDILESEEKGPVYDDAINELQPKGFLNRWRSSFQHDNYDYEVIVQNEGGHPPVNDILSAFTNYIFYQRLHLLGDIESYHLFEVLTAFLIVAAVGVITYLHFGLFSSMVASLSLSIYPLFFSESHFNIKDPPLASFFGLAVIFFYLGVVRKNWKMILISSIATGLALGTKLNVVFAPLIVGPWLVFFLVTKFAETKKLFLTRGVFFVLMFYIPIALGLVYILWPYLWSDTINNVNNILGFYKQIGIGTPGEMASYIVTKWRINIYPVIWIVYTTQIPILILTVWGLFYSLYLIIFKKQHFPLLVVLWLLVPIVRASWPNASIYGGVRQLMEFIPPLAIMAGIGTYSFLKVLRNSRFILLLISASMLFATYEIVRIHPNENVYFNQIIGGLSGAKAANIPYWGNTYGNVYYQGAVWLNENAEPNAKLGLPIATMGNLSRNKLRADINFSNSHWSGLKREGEYEIEMDFEWPPKYWYSFQYYDKYLNPVFVAEVDGVPLLKIWKNDLEHTKEDFREEVVYKPASLVFRKNLINRELWIDMGSEVYLTGIKIKHSKFSCLEQKGGYMAVSLDNKDWVKEPDPISGPQVPVTATGWSDENFVFLFPGRLTRYIVLDPQMDNTCLLKNSKVTVTGLKKLP